MKALQGIRVVDLSRVLAGPYCGQLLADMGAEVIKIEGLEGDENRRWPPFMQGDKSSNFHSVNRGKKGLALNLKAVGAQEVVRRLAEKADVLLHSFLPKTASRLGLVEDRLRERNPRLVICTISGYGHSGELSNKPGYDLMVQAFSGIMALTGYEDSSPVRTGVSFIDMSTGLTAYAGILTALINREKTGRGTTVRASLLESAIALHGYNVVAWCNSGFVPQREGSGVSHIVPYQAFKCLDGYLLAGATNDATFARFCEAIEMSQLANDKRFQGPETRVANRHILIPILEQCFSGKKMLDCVKRLEVAGVPTAPLHSLDQILSHPQVLANEMIVEVPSNDGPLKLVGLPFKLGEGGGIAQRVAPELGADTREVLTSLAYTGAEIEKLLREGAIAAAKM